MKTMSKRAWVLYVFIAAFLAGLIVLFYTFYTNADSWAMKKANRHLYSSGTLSVAGSIKDETGAVLAETKDGKRVYNSDKTVRTATMHTVGDSEGYIATGVQTSYKDVITGYMIVTPFLLLRIVAVHGIKFKTAITAKGKIPSLLLGDRLYRGAR